MFFSGLRHALKAQGVKIKIKQLCEFFDYIKDVCPWFLYDRTIYEKKWNRVGEVLKEHYQAFGPEKVPVTPFYFWNLIIELLSQRHQDPVVANAIETGEEILLKNKLNKIDKKKLNQENDTQGVKKNNKKEGEDLMYSDSDVETSDKKTIQTYRLPKLSHPCRKLGSQTRILSPHLSQKHKNIQELALRLRNYIQL